MNPVIPHSFIVHPKFGIIIIFLPVSHRTWLQNSYLKISRENPLAYTQFPSEVGLGRPFLVDVVVIDVALASCWPE